MKSTQKSKLVSNEDGYIEKMLTYFATYLIPQYKGIYSNTITVLLNNVRKTYLTKS